MSTDNQYLSFLRSFETHQDIFDDCGYQYFLIGVESVDGQNILNEDLTILSQKYKKSTFIINSVESCNNLIPEFNNINRDLKNEIFIVNLFGLEDKDSSKIINNLNGMEYRLRNNNCRFAFTFSIEQYRNIISYTEFFQFRTTTYFDENELIKTNRLYSDLNKELKEENISKRRPKI